jgi:MFS family permease
MPDAHTIHKHTFLGIVPSYFARKAKSQVRELYMSSAIMDLAQAMILFFEPIYLYQLGLPLTHIMVFYLCVYVLYFFLMPLGAKFAKYVGFEHSIFLATPFFILYYLFLSFGARSLYFLFPAVFMFALQKTFYWPGFHADFASYGQDVEQGREISTRMVILSVVFFVGPFIGGTVMHFFGFTTLFILVTFLIILSNVPLLLTPEKFQPSSFSYRDAYKRLFKKENRRNFFAYLGFGEELILLTLWPIFMFIILKTAFSTGIVLAGSTLVTTCIVLYIGKLTDKRPRTSILRYTTVVYSLGWILRLLASTPLGVFIVHTVSHTSKTSLQVPLTAITYHNARVRGVVKNVVFFEMSLVVGKIISILLVLGILLFIDTSYHWPAIFMLASAFTLLYSRLRE